jgi:hypothetical protein
LFYIGGTLWRNFRGRLLNTPTAFIQSLSATVAKPKRAGLGMS